MWKADIAENKKDFPLALSSPKHTGEGSQNRGQIPSGRIASTFKVRCHEQTRAAAGYFIAERALIYLPLKAA